MITLKTKDICEALGIKKHQLRSWTEALEPYSSMSTNERSARKYDTGDLLFFAVIFQIERNFGLSLKSIMKFSLSLYETLRAPKKVERKGNIFVDIEKSDCKWLNGSMPPKQGIIFDTTEAEAVVCEFLGVAPTQSNLQFGFSLVS